MNRAQDFQAFVTENEFDMDAFLRATLTYVRRTNRRIYDRFEWPVRVPPHKQHDLFIELDDRIDDIITALADLGNSPDYLTRPLFRRNSLLWNNAGSLSTYARQCHIQYSEQKFVPKIYKEFLTCFVAMNYFETMRILKHLSVTPGDQMVESMRELRNVRDTVSRATHDRLTRIGERCFVLIDIFHGIAGLSILSVHQLKVIDKMTVADFSRFAEHLRCQVRENGQTVQEIIRTDVHIRLVNYYGRSFPPEIRQYLGVQRQL